MANLATDRPRDVEAVHAHEAWLYRTGQAAALLALLVFRRWLAAEFMLLRTMGVVRAGPKALPTSASEWFALLRVHPLMGFTLLNGFDMMTFVLACVVYLALYAALRRTDRISMMLGLALSFAATVVYVSSNPAIAMLRFSVQYGAATTDAQRALIAAAAQALLATHSPAALGQNVAFVLFNVAGLIIATVMLRSSVFGRGTAWLGILFNGFALGFPLGSALVPGNTIIPGVAWIIAVVFWVFWYIAIIGRLGQLARGGPAARR